MNVAEAIFTYLYSKGIDRVFVVDGAAAAGLIHGAKRAGMIITPAPNEQCASFMAEGWAKVKGLPGVVIVTSGPGGQNIVTGICNSYYDSVPMIFITGQVNTGFIGDATYRQEGFQYWPITQVVKPITKEAILARSAQPIEMAFRRSLQDRHGPVVIDIPIDVQRQEAEPIAEAPPSNRTFDTVNVWRAAGEFVEAFEKAERPCIILGGGARDSIDRIKQLAAELDCPVFPTWNALDLVPNDYALYGGRIGTYGGDGRNFGVQNSDLILALGTRLSGRITGGKPESFAPDARKFVVDIERASPLTTVLSDAGWFVAAVAKQRYLRGYKKRDRSGWKQWVFDRRDKYDPVRPHLDKKELHPYVAMRKLGELLEPDAVVVADCGGNLVCVNHSLRLKTGQRYFTNNGNSPMGFAVAAAVGAKYAAPDRQVVCIIGDGGWQVNECMRHYLNDIKVFIINNECYGITKQYQETNFPDEPTLACDKESGYKADTGIWSVERYVRDNNRLEYVLKNTLQAGGPQTCEIYVPGFRTYEPRIAGNVPIHQMLPALTDAELSVNILVREKSPKEGETNG